MNTQQFINSLNKFPVSTETFDFIQNQILLLQQLTALAADNIIIREPNGDTPGLCIINGELLPLTGEKDNRIQILQTTEDITAGAETFRQARTLRVARYNNSQGVYRPDLHTLENIDAMRTRLSNEMLGLRLNAVPKQTIIDWAGTPTEDALPYGWIPCCRLPVQDDGHWEYLLDTYDHLDITASAPVDGYFRITQCNGVNIPDLTGRFTLCTDPGDDAMQHTATGGTQYVTLTLRNTPRQSNTVNESSDRSTTLAITNNYYPDDVDQFEIMPPYYALFKLIKVI